MPGYFTDAEEHCFLGPYHAIDHPWSIDPLGTPVIGHDFWAVDIASRSCPSILHRLPGPLVRDITRIGHINVDPDATEPGLDQYLDGQC